MTDEPLPPGDTVEEPAATAPSEASAAEAGAAEAPEEVPDDAPDDSAETSRSWAGLELYLLRHADAGDPLAWTGDDDDRPLTGKGRKQARRMGRWLADLGRRPAVILSSPKARAIQTATIVAATLAMKPRIDPRLAGPLDDAVLDAILDDAIARAGRNAKRVMLVGHDPDFSAMASSLAGGPVALKKGALARIDLDGSTGPASGSLRWLVPAEAVPER